LKSEGGTRLNRRALLKMQSALQPTLALYQSAIATRPQRNLTPTVTTLPQPPKDAAMMRKIKILLSDLPALAMLAILIAIVVGAGAVGVWMKANFG
jgi:hypothetical protein